MVKTLPCPFSSREVGLIPGPRSKIPHDARYGKKKKKKKRSHWVGRNKALGSARFTIKAQQDLVGMATGIGEDGLRMQRKAICEVCRAPMLYQKEALHTEEKCGLAPLPSFVTTALQYSCLGNPLDRGTLWATVHGVANKLDVIEHSCINLALGSRRNFQRVWPEYHKAGNEGWICR